MWLAACGAWALGAAGAAAVATRHAAGWKPAAVLTACAALQTVGFVVCRDLVRDASLARFGFDVWDRAVVVNWSVLGLFLVLFTLFVRFLPMISITEMREMLPRGQGGRDGHAVMENAK